MKLWWRILASLLLSAANACSGGGSLPAPQPPVVPTPADFALNPSAVKIGQLLKSACPTPLPANTSCFGYNGYSTTHFALSNGIAPVEFKPAPGSGSSFTAVSADPRIVVVSAQPALNGNVGTFGVSPVAAGRTTVRLAAANGQYEDLPVVVTTLQVTIDASAHKGSIMPAIDYGMGAYLGFTDPLRGEPGGTVYTILNAPAYTPVGTLQNPNDPGTVAYSFLTGQRVVSAVGSGTGAPASAPLTLNEGADNTARLIVPGP